MANWLTIAEVKPFLQWDATETIYDPLLQLVIDGTCQAVEEYIRRPVIARELMTTSDGGSDTVFLTPTVFAIASVTEGGVALTETDYALYPETGILRRRAGSRPGRWQAGLQSVVVTYTAGLARTAEEVPPNVRIAAMIGCKFLLRNGPEDYGTRLGDGVMIRPDKFPRQSLWLLDPYRVV